MVKTYKQFLNELRIRFKDKNDGYEDELNLKDYAKMQYNTMATPIAAMGAIAGGAIAGPTGAVVGGATGWALGKKYHNNKFPTSDSNVKIQWGKTIKANMNPKKYSKYPNEK